MIVKEIRFDYDAVKKCADILKLSVEEFTALAVESACQAVLEHPDEYSVIATGYLQ